MNLEQSISDLELRIKGIVDTVVGLPISVRNSSNQRLGTPYIEIHIDDIEEVGRGVVDDTNARFDKSYKEYEVTVEFTVYKTSNPSIPLTKLLHAFTTQKATYDKYFTKQTSGFLRASSIVRRDMPIDKAQIELRAKMRCVFSMVVEYVDTIEDLGIQTIKLGTPADGGVLVHAETDLKWYQEVTYIP